MDSALGTSPARSPEVESRGARWKRHCVHCKEQLTATARLLGPSAQFLTTTEAHTYAYSVAACLVLAFFPFFGLLEWCAHQFLRAPALYVVHDLLRMYLPTAVANRMIVDLAPTARGNSLQIYSLVMLAISSSGIFLPFEVALNSVWNFPRRSYIGNQIISLALVLGCGVLAYGSVQAAAAGDIAVAHLVVRLTGHLLSSWGWLGRFLDWLVLKSFALPATMFSFFLIYWRLPHGKVRAGQVWPAAVYTGLLAEVFKSVFRWLLPLLDFGHLYGSFQFAVTLLVWGYGAALLLLFGASLSARGVLTLPDMRTVWRRRRVEAAAAGEDSSIAG